MDLALHLGMPAEALRRQMSERELREWQRYDERRGLPWRRIELYLAQVAMTVAQVNTSKPLRLADFMFKPRDAEDTALEDDDGEPPTLEDVAAQFGGRVYRKKKD